MACSPPLSCRFPLQSNGGAKGRERACRPLHGPHHGPGREIMHTPPGQILPGGPCCHQDAPRPTGPLEPGCLLLERPDMGRRVSMIGQDKVAARDGSSQHERACQARTPCTTRGRRSLPHGPGRTPLAVEPGLAGRGLCRRAHARGLTVASASHGPTAGGRGRTGRGSSSAPRFLGTLWPSRAPRWRRACRC